MRLSRIKLPNINSLYGRIFAIFLVHHVISIDSRAITATFGPTQSSRYSRRTLQTYGRNA